MNVDTVVQVGYILLGTLFAMNLIVLIDVWKDRPARFQDW